jgi:hypothetical protein
VYHRRLRRPSSAKHAAHRSSAWSASARYDLDLYEGQWHVDGRLHEVTVTADGRIVEYEEELAPEQVPPPVRAAAIAALPGARRLVFVRLQSGNYEVEAVVNGKEQEVTISAAGQLMASDDDGDDADDAADHDDDDGVGDDADDDDGDRDRAAGERERGGEDADD